MCSKNEIVLRTLAVAFAFCSYVSAQAPTAQPGMPGNAAHSIDFDISKSDHLTAAEAQALEAKIKANPDDAQLRAQLLGYYFFLQTPTASAIVARQEQILWMIRNHADDRFAGSPFCGIDPATDPDGYVAAKELWKQQAEKPLRAVAVVENEFRFLMVPDPELAEELVKRAATADPNNPLWHENLAEIYSSPAPTTKPAEEAGRNALAEMEKAYVLTKAPDNRFYILTDLPTAAMACGDNVKTTDYAKQLLAQAPRFKHDWNYGNAIHKANLALGRVAFAIGDMETAKSRLLDAGKTPGSPQLDSFGPNMVLAQKLLKIGEKDAVLQYLNLCGKFWKMDNGQLEAWKKTIKDGGIPDFGANLIY
jgi:tetratricopeptide (TPR) repeat protein